MADFKLSAEQQRIVDARNSSLLVAAAAGSGKTAVLVKRIMERIKEGSVSVDRLLIVTFTRLAASEMLERLESSLQKEISNNPFDDMLNIQYAKLKNAEISTIDSFCGNIVKENFELCDINPDFTIMEETIENQLEDDIIDEIFESEYESASGKDNDFLSLVRSYGTYKDDKNVRNYIKKILKKAENEPWPTEWLKNIQTGCDKGIPDTLYQDIANETYKMISETYAVLREINQGFEAAGGTKQTEKMKYELQKLSELVAEKPDYDTYFQKIKFEFERFPGGKTPGDPETKKVLTAKRGAVRDSFKKYVSRYYDFSREESNLLFEHSIVPLKKLIDLTVELKKRLDETKKEKNSFTFGDIEHMALNILCTKDDCGNVVRTEIAREISSRYDEIMIDEYQDSSFIQEYILASVSHDRSVVKESGAGEEAVSPNLFMVGDVKQSIYGFRNARPELFIQKYEEFESTGTHIKIDLSKNYRSRESVLNSVNVLLAPVMRKHLTEIEYDSASALHAGSVNYENDDTESPKYNTEIILTETNPDARIVLTETGDLTKTAVEAKSLDETDSPQKVNNKDNSDGTGEEEDYENDDEESSSDDEDDSTAYLEALTVGRKIREMVEGGFKVSDGLDKNQKPIVRNIKYGDFALLFLYTAGVAKIYTDIFQNMRIPITAELTKGFFDTPEIKKIICFLKILDNPYDDISFAAVLHSEIVNIGAEELGLIATYKNKDKKDKLPLYKCVRELCENPESGLIDSVKEKLQRFFDIYDALLVRKNTDTVHSLIEAIYDETGFKDIVSVMPYGERRRGNLDLFVNIAKKYEHGAYAGVHDFIHYIDRCIEDKENFGEASSDAADDAVRILTIHKSKGLEFPVVFLCDIDKKFNMKDLRESIIMNHEMGIASNYIDTKKRVKFNTIKQNYMVDSEKRKLISEEARKLYVALTRAKEKLFIVGKIKDPGKKISEWENCFTSNDGAFLLNDILKVNRLMDFICPSLFVGQKIDTAEFSKKDIKDTIRITRNCGTESFSADFDVTLVAYAGQDAAFMLKNSGYTRTELKKQAEKKRKSEGAIKANPESVKATEPEATHTPATIFDDPDIKAEIKAQKEFVYPYTAEAEAPVRVSVSELKHIEIENLMEEAEREAENVPYLTGLCVEEKSDADLNTENAPDTGISNVNSPDADLNTEEPRKFKSEPEVSKGALRGTLYHEVFEKLQYNGKYDTFEDATKSVSEDIDYLIKEGFLEADILDTVSINKIAKFCMSDIGKRMIKAEKSGHLHREQQFVYNLTPEEYNFYSKTDKAATPVMVQGIIDAYIDDGDSITIIDYKTDKVYRDAETELRAKYHVQLDIYALAVTQITGKKVKEKIIYSVAKDIDFAV